MIGKVPASHYRAYGAWGYPVPAKDNKLSKPNMKSTILAIALTVAALSLVSCASKKAAAPQQVDMGMHSSK
ncbi:hypothetical protein BH11VER1_BH11VER1_00240 [soil metagenome]